MSKSWIALLAMALALPAFAQDEPPPAEEQPTAEESAAPEAVEEVPAEGTPQESPAADESPAEPWKLYLGVDQVNTRIALSVPPSVPANEFDSTMIRVRAGMRVLEAVALELHYGADRADEEQGEITTDSYYGVYFVPTATVLDFLELAFPVGYGRSEFGDSGEALGSIAYGIDAEIPIRGFYDGLPDFRLTAGWMVYYQKSDARVYGANLGLRYDFSF